MAARGQLAAVTLASFEHQIWNQSTQLATALNNLQEALKPKQQTLRRGTALTSPNMTSPYQADGSAYPKHAANLWHTCSLVGSDERAPIILQ